MKAKVTAVSVGTGIGTASTAAHDSIVYRTQILTKEAPSISALKLTVISLCLSTSCACATSQSLTASCSQFPSVPTQLMAPPPTLQPLKPPG